MTPPPPQQPLLGAASPLTADVVTGPVRRAVVLARFDTAVYLAVGGHEEVLPVVTSDALMLPTSVRLPVRSDALRWGVDPGDTESLTYRDLQKRRDVIRERMQEKPKRRRR